MPTLNDNNVNQCVFKCHQCRAKDAKDDNELLREYREETVLPNIRDIDDGDDDGGASDGVKKKHHGIGQYVNYNAY